EEARALLALVLDAVDAQGIPDDERPLDDAIAIGRMMYPIEGLAYFGGDTDTMLRTGRREIAIWDRVDGAAELTAAGRLTAARGRSLGLQLIGFAHAMRGEPEAAVASMDASVAVASRSGDEWLLAVLTMRRALVHFMIGEHEKAKADYDASVPSLRSQGELWFLSLALEGMAMNAMALGDPLEGARYARESVTVLRPEPDAWFISRSLDTMAFILVSRLDDPLVPADQASRTAARLLGAAESLRHRCGAGVIRPDMAREAAMVQSLHARLGVDGYLREFTAGSALSLQDVFALMDDDPVVSAYTSTAPALPREAERLSLRVLGPFAMDRSNTPVPSDAVPMGKTRELLLFLLLNDRATKDDIGLALWPDASAAQVRNAFHVTLHHLRRHLGPDHWIAFEAGTYRLDRAPRADVVLEVDLDRVLAASAGIRLAFRRREAVDAGTLDAWRMALEAGSGELAQGFGGGEWLVSCQDRIRNVWVEAMETLAQLLRIAGRTDDVLGTCELLVAREPLRESAHRLLMEAMAARGEPARALAHYEALTALLQREVGSRPAAETRAFAEGLRRLP
ncbi:MAG TPA: bacterial transcriptional activator domain-containing protein, partial [Gemmatimonas sp.]|nr:bacterial transcriptional activator domain-containing protein [Gemmatimonas sp.]